MSPLLLFTSMVAVFVLGVFLFRLPIGLALVLSAICGALFGGEGFPIRHLIEGQFGYLDAILIIASAMVFMKVILYSGLLDTIARKIIDHLHHKPVLLLLSMMGVIMFPGMITGSSTAAVLTTGALVAPVLMALGIPREKAAAIIALGAIYGMIAPPVNVPVMIIGGGIDMPYVGFGIPLLLASLPLAVLVAVVIGLKYVHDVDLDAIKDELPESCQEKFGLRIYLPIVVLVVLMIGEKLFPTWFPPLGLSLAFLLASLVGVVTGKRLNFFKVAREAVHEALPVLGILMGVGMFIQIMTLTGVRGMLVVFCIGLPSLFLYLGIATSMPLFGAISSYGSASVLGVPFVLALLGQNEILTASALSLIAGLGDLMPPTALAGIFAAQIVGVKNYFKVLRYCLWPAALTAVYGIVLILNANRLMKMFSSLQGSLLMVGIFGLYILVVVVVSRLFIKRSNRKRSSC
ncbi:MAG: TRAP transporter large permease subunit [Proteobacteria bacterium]|nr:TRAP transporter large permease subunit [Pseudomonadota bacterium]